MARKSEQLQIRLTPGEKAALKRRARTAGQDVSTYVLSQALPPNQLRFEALVARLAEGVDSGFVLAELNDLLSPMGAAELRDTVAHADVRRLSPFLQNYVAAMVEHASWLKRVRPPAWAAEVRPLDDPWFASTLWSLRLHLLSASPVAFKRRNLFVDASVGDRV